MMKPNADYDLNSIISRVLKYGVIISTVLLLTGLTLIIMERPVGLPSSVQQLVSSNYGKPTLDVGQLFSGAAQGMPIFVIQLGLVVLLATPVVRVFASVIVFAAERDRTYVAITLTVLAILLVSIFIVGPAEAHAS
jgi:uncharacterized membrane protein